MSSFSLKHNSWAPAVAAASIGQSEKLYELAGRYDSRFLYYNIFRKKFKKGDMIQVLVGCQCKTVCISLDSCGSYIDRVVGVVLERRKIFPNRLLNLYGYEYIAIVGDERWIVRGNKQNRFSKICNLSEHEKLEEAIDKFRRS